MSTAYGVYRAISSASIDPNFLHYFVRSDPFNWELVYRSRGVWKSRLQLTDERFLAAPLLVPPAEEQAAIVKYLGHAHARIDRAIAAKRKLIALLEEQKRAIIHQAVTRGLNPDVPLKDSGIPWLGHIPAHWELRRLRDLASRPVAGVWGDDPHESNSEDWIRCIRVADFDFRNLAVTDDKTTSRAVPRHARLRRLLEKGDLLVEKSGGGEKSPVGRVVLYERDEPAITSNFVSRYRPNTSQILPLYLAMTLASAYRSGATWPAVRQTTGIQNLDETEYRSLLIPVPSLEEQAGVVASVRASAQETDSAISRCQREIALLQEFRTRLTSDVVTGQVDVREIAASLPDFNDERLADEPSDVLGDPLDDAEEYLDEAALA